MNHSSTYRAATPLLAFTLTIAGLSACSSTTNESSAPVSTQGSAEATPSDTASGSLAPTTVPSALIRWESIEDFVSATHNSDFDTAFALAAPHSPAHQYVVHQQAVAEAQIAAGNTAQDPAYTIAADPQKGTVTIDYTDDDGNPAGYTWSDFRVDDRGLVQSWTGKSGPVADVLWSKDSEVRVAGTKVSLVSAYLSNSGGLWVVLDVAPKTYSVTPDYTPRFVGSDKRTREATSSAVPDLIEKGTSGYLLYAFEGAKFGGTLTLTITDAGYNTRGAAKIRIS